ncbi:MAG: phenylalanine--tRNA ligase subunit beta [Cyanobacteria bacterium P01_H01_bin.74]
MRVSLNWLSEFIDGLTAPASEITAALTRSGLEVEAVETIGPQFRGVVLGQITAIEPHPNADKLRLVTVNLGKETSTVVCGAANVRDGILIAFATEGAQVINSKDGQLFTLGKATIRGVASSGMICALSELGLGDRYHQEENGIWVLDTILDKQQHHGALGHDLIGVLGLSADTILTVAPTANRGDLMAMIGIAREVCALFNCHLKPSVFESVPEWPEKSTLLPARSENPANADFSVALSSPDVCGYYAAAYLKNVAVKPSPAWLAERVTAAGMRSINTVVDITNYLMLAYGQPLHAFDADKLRAVAASKSSAMPVVLDVCSGHDHPDLLAEPVITLDDQARQLSADSVAVTAAEVPVALAGVMGLANSEVDDNTTAIVLESAFFPPATTRQSAKSVGLRSEASARFERGIDPSQCKAVLMRAIQLLSSEADATLITVIESSGKTSKSQTESTVKAQEAITPVAMTAAAPISLRFSRLNAVLGLTVPEETVKNILSQLGFGVSVLPETDSDLPVLSVTVPPFRAQDVCREIDLIEEIIRIYGYDAVPFTLPKQTAFASKPSLSASVHQTIARVMQTYGLSAVVTPSLIGDDLLKKTGTTLNDAHCVSVQNSHSAEHTKMRQSLLPTLLEVVQYNLAQGNSSVWIYELGRVYFKVGKASKTQAGVSEPLMLAGAMMGQAHQPLGTKTQWTSSQCYFQAKGVIETMLSRLGFSVARCQFNAPENPDDLPMLHPGQCAEIRLHTAVPDKKTMQHAAEKKPYVEKKLEKKPEKKPVGFLGIIHPAIQQQLKLKQPVAVFELNVALLTKALKKQLQPIVYQPLSSYPSVQRDVALLAPLSLSHQSIIQAMSAVNDDTLKSISLFDEYRGDQVAAGHRSLAYRLSFQSSSKTLTDSDVDTRLSAIKSQLKQSLEAQGIQIAYR